MHLLKMHLLSERDAVPARSAPWSGQNWESLGCMIEHTPQPVARELTHEGTSGKTQCWQKRVSASEARNLLQKLCLCYLKFTLQSRLLFRENYSSELSTSTSAQVGLVSPSGPPVAVRLTTVPTSDGIRSKDTFLPLLTVWLTAVPSARVRVTVSS